MKTWKLSRRRFLGFTAATGALIAAGSYMDFKTWTSAAPESNNDVKRIPTLCNGCTSRCGMIVTVANGRIFRVDGNPDHPYSKGKLCARAHGAATLAYHPDRLTQPMKRGANGTYEPISWQQAFSEISHKLKRILDKNGPQSFVYLENPKESGVVYGQRFAKALGSNNIFSHHTTCSLSRDSAFKHVLGDIPASDIANSKFIIFIGRSYGDGIRPSSVQSLVKARSKGARVIIIDPRLNSTSPLADQWIPIKPGTDLALLLAMANVIIGENLHDEAFVKEQSIGFDEFAAAMKEYTPEWASRQTDIPASVIRQLAVDFAKAKPKAVIEQSWKGAFGCNYENSTETSRMVVLVNALIGNINRAGGYQFGVAPHFGKMDQYPAPKANAERVDGAGIKGKYLLTYPSKGIAQLVPDLAKQGVVKAALVQHYNPVRNTPDPKTILEGYKQLELLVVCDIWMSETAQIADYVLPEPSFLERTETVEGVSGSKAVVALRQQVINKIHPDTEPFHEIILGLAKAMGLDRYFFELDEYNRQALAPLGVSYEDLKLKGAITVGEEWKEGFTKLKSKSGKVEFSCQTFADAGFTAVPKWIPPKVTIQADEFRLIHGKQNVHSHTSTTNIPILKQVTIDYELDRLWINTARAKQLGIQDGDTVIVESAIHSGKAKVKVTEAIHPEAVFYPSHYGSFSNLSHNKKFGLSVCDFVSHQFEAMSGAANMMEVAVKVRKDGV